MTKRIQISLTNTEHKYLAAKAKSCRMSFSKYVVSRALGGPGYLVCLYEDAIITKDEITTLCKDNLKDIVRDEIK